MVCYFRNSLSTIRNSNWLTDSAHHSIQKRDVITYPVAHQPPLHDPTAKISLYRIPSRVQDSQIRMKIKIKKKKPEKKRPSYFFGAHRNSSDRRLDSSHLSLSIP